MANKKNAWAQVWSDKAFRREVAGRLRLACPNPWQALGSKMKELAHWALAGVGAVAVLTLLGAVCFGSGLALQTWWARWSHPAGSMARLALDDQSQERWSAIAQGEKGFKTAPLEAALRQWDKTRPARVVFYLGPREADHLRQFLRRAKENQERSREQEDYQAAVGLARAVREGASLEQAAARLRSFARASDAQEQVNWVEQRLGAAPKSAMGVGEVLRAVWEDDEGGQASARDRALAAEADVGSFLLGALALMGVIFSSLAIWLARQWTREALEQAAQKHQERWASESEAQEIAGAAAPSAPKTQAARRL